jgi:hypothetical protein
VAKYKSEIAGLSIRNVSRLPHFLAMYYSCNVAQAKFLGILPMHFPP